MNVSLSPLSPWKATEHLIADTPSPLPSFKADSAFFEVRTVSNDRLDV